MSAREERFWALAAGYLEGDLEPAGRRELLGLLRADPELRTAFLKEVELDETLRMVNAPAADEALGALAEQVLQAWNAPPAAAKPARKDRSRPRRMPARRAAANRLVPAAAALIAAAVLLYALRAPQPPAPQPVQARQTPAPPPAAPAEPAARVVEAAPGVELSRAGRTQPAAAGLALEAGDLVATPGAGTAALRLADGSVLRLDPSTRLTLRSPSELLLSLGSVDVAATPRTSGRLALATPFATATVIGTRFAVHVNDSATHVEVQEGRVRVARGPQDAVEVAPRQFVVAKPGAPLEVEALPEPDLAERPEPPREAAREVRVATVEALQAALAALQSDSTVVIEAGTYRLTRPLVVGGVKRVTLRGATGNPDDVRLLGQGLRARAETSALLHLRDAEAVRCADFTLAEAWDNLVQLHGEEGCRAPQFTNVRFRDAGLTFVHATSAGRGRGVEGAVLERCRFEFTQSGARREFSACVSISGGRGWIVRNCRFERIPNGPVRPNFLPAAVFAAGASQGTRCESNVFVDCVRAICFGVEEERGERPSHDGGLIVNNTVARRADFQNGDAAILVFDAPGARVLHNTILLNGTYPNAIEYRFKRTTGVTIANNLCDAAVLARDGAAGTERGNLLAAAPGWFDGAERGDLHLRAGTPAEDAAAALDELDTQAARTDLDGQARPAGAGPDVGADEVHAGAAARP
ncbi:MAG: FecR domain-containing protein [Planctomycetes bacterium]|nr:FecR domain-containing protein [Planctomycetota bacterium]